MLRAKDIMTQEVISVTPQTTVIELAEILSSHNIGGAPVLDTIGNLLGVVTESDLIDQHKKVHLPTYIAILDSFFYLENPEKLEVEMKKIAGSTVGDIYSKELLTVEEETPLDELATIMAEKSVHTLPVVRGKKLVGVIGKQDIINTLFS